MKISFPLLLTALITSAPFLGLSAQEDPIYQGYVEGEFVWVGLPEAGILYELAVERGQMVEVGQLLFRLNDEIETARRDAAAAVVAEARARLEDHLKGLRESEINAIRARLDEARAERELAVLDLNRQEELRGTGAASEQAFDRAKARFQAALAGVQRLESELVTAGLAAREDEVRAAEAVLRQAEARLLEAEEALNLRSAWARQDGLVFDTYHWPGEAVRAARPVVSLLPPAHVKLRFFVNETILGALRIGQLIEASCDGCEGPVLGRINYISTKAEFTPPVIFSEDVRDKLVYLIEARPQGDGLQLRPGQPIDVRFK
jgi:HlyD family secretion protein